VLFVAVGAETPSMSCLLYPPAVSVGGVAKFWSNRRRCFAPIARVPGQSRLLPVPPVAAGVLSIDRSSRLFPVLCVEVQAMTLRPRQWPVLSVGEKDGY